MSKYYLMYTSEAFHVLGILDPRTSLLLPGEVLQSSPIVAVMGRTCDGRSHSHAIDVGQLTDFDLTMYTFGST